MPPSRIAFFGGVAGLVPHRGAWLLAADRPKDPLYLSPMDPLMDRRQPMPVRCVERTEPGVRMLHLGAQVPEGTRPGKVARDARAKLPDHTDVGDGAGLHVGDTNLSTERLAGGQVFDDRGDAVID